MMRTRGDFGGAIIGGGGLVWAAGMVIGLLECLKWLKNGAWSSFTLPQTFGPLGVTGWGGVDQIAQWAWVQPLWSVVAFIGLAVVAIGFIIEHNN